MGKFFRLVTPVLFLFFFPALSVNEFNQVVFKDFSGKSLHNIEVKILPNGERAYTVADGTYRAKRDDFKTDLLLNFNRRAKGYIRDNSANYDVLYSRYHFNPNSGSLGGGSALFFKENHGMKIATRKGLWLTSVSDLGSFTIEFRLRITNRGGNGILFSRMSPFAGVDKGIDIRLVGGSIRAKLHNMFRKPDGKWTGSSYIFTSLPRLGQWYHYSLSFDRNSGKLSTYLNGREVHCEYMTATGEPGEDVFIPYFSHSESKSSELFMADLPLVKVGLGFRGGLDELRVSSLPLEKLREEKNINISTYREAQLAGRIPFNYEGIITSPVYDFGSSGTMVDSFSWLSDLPEKTFIWAEFRIADRYFDRNSLNLKWYRVNNGQRGIFLKKNSFGRFLRGKYYQWRIHLIPSPDGGKSPAFKQVVMHYRKDQPPAKPIFPEVIASKGKRVILRWKKNVDFDLGGYRIYYGTREGVFDGILSVRNGKAITNSLEKNGYVQVEIDNDLIEENRRYDKRGVLKYPFLRENVLYFFAVSAYDSYRVGTSYNHESKLSNTVTARPYGGSEIN